MDGPAASRQARLKRDLRTISPARVPGSGESRCAYAAGSSVFLRGLGRPAGLARAARGFAFGRAPLAVAAAARESGVVLQLPPPGSATIAAYAMRNRRLVRSPHGIRHGLGGTVPALRRGPDPWALCLPPDFPPCPPLPQPHRRRAACAIRAALGSARSSRWRAKGTTSSVQTRAKSALIPASASTAAISPERPKRA